MQRFGTRTLIAALVLSIPSLAAADPKPKNAQPASAERIRKAYSGKTDLWTDGCNGGIYYAANGQARAWCADNPDTLGVGTWSVDDQGQLCQTLRWYYPEGDGTASSENETECISHLDRKWSLMWRNSPGDAEWWALDEYSGLVYGFKFQNGVRAAQAKLGL